MIEKLFLEMQKAIKVLEQYLSAEFKNRGVKLVKFEYPELIARVYRNDISFWEKSVLHLVFSQRKKDEILIVTFYPYEINKGIIIHLWPGDSGLSVQISFRIDFLDEEKSLDVLALYLKGNINSYAEFEAKISGE